MYGSCVRVRVLISLRAAHVDKKEHFSRPIQPQYRISDTSRKRYKLRNETIAPVSRFFVTANPSCSTVATTDQPSCRHLDSPLNMVSAYLNGYLVGFLDLGM
ncbi:uncharacterized protein LOC117204200 [Bombus bifarius]|uniref:Uncharacterized protein LOC117204200 n=1 Tax=Bombus bifarius TaxID=103933 RepID=A0A6P8M742_9HYME|nr:uncharacterized protein LOC117155889 [Bombus vancouverensis nearcticus]XP_033297277.1 uncharacterized protein LOC117204200 [Bombus bifarius]